MNFGKIFDRKKSDTPAKNQEEIYRIKEEIERHDRIFESELPAKYTLLEQFSIDELKSLCDKLIGVQPPVETFTDSKSGHDKELPKYKEDYIHFVIDELKLSDMMKYALENKIVSEKFFDNKT